MAPLPTGSGLSSRTTASTSIPATTTASLSPSSPSLAQLAAGSNSPLPRRSLANLAATSNPLSASASSRTALATSTSALEGAGATRTRRSPSLSQLAAANTNANQGGAPPPRRSLASLAQSSSAAPTPTRTYTTGATGVAAATGGRSSLSQLASASTQSAPRRSLVGLARAGSTTTGSSSLSSLPSTIPSQTRTPVTSSTTTASALGGPAGSGLGGRTTGAGAAVGLTLRSGGGLAGLSRNVGNAGSIGGDLHKDVLDAGTSSPLSPDLAVRDGRTQASLEGSSLEGMAGGLNEVRSESAAMVSTPGSETAGGSSAQLRSISGSEEMSSNIVNYSHEDHSLGSYSTAGDEEALLQGSGYSPLIAPPSHFAVSIFEKLDPVPAPKAMSTASALGLGGLRGEQMSGSGVYYTATAAAGMSRAGGEVKMFAFDVPSPDDIVFKAQGHRPAATRT